MKVCVLGAGAIGLTYCGLLTARGHDVLLLSESGEIPPRQTFEGAFEGTFRFSTVPSLEEAAQRAEVLVFARRAEAIRPTIEAVVPLLCPHHAVVISAELSFASLHFAAALAAAGKPARIIPWSTTLATAQKRPDGIRVGTIRGTVDMAVTDALDPLTGKQICSDLFGDNFRVLRSPLAIGLSNLNPQIHLANGLANLTRIEKGEDWENYGCITPAVGRLIESLDRERLAVAQALGIGVRDVFEHYVRTFPKIRPASVSDMAQQVCRDSPGTKGPTELATRYLTEDIPYGIVPLCNLARDLGVAVPLHEAGVTLVSGYLGRDLRRANDLGAVNEDFWRKTLLCSEAS